MLELEEHTLSEETLPLIVLSDRMNAYGIVVDQFLGERELVVQELDARLGKVPDISAGAFMEDGSPILIVDVEDMVRSIDTILSGGASISFSMGRSRASAGANGSWSSMIRSRCARWSAAYCKTTVTTCRQL